MKSPLDSIESSLNEKILLNTKEIRSLDSILQESKRYSSENANNLWVRGFEHEQNKRFQKAIDSYQKLSHPRFRNNSKRQWAKFRIAFIYYKQGKLEEAEKAFLEAKKEPFTWSSNASRMFLGDIYHQQGKDSLAKEAYLDCIQDFPLAYYAHRSRSKLIEYKLMDSSQVPFARGYEASEEETLQWIRNAQKTGKPDPTYSKDRYDRMKHLFLLVLPKKHLIYIMKLVIKMPNVSTSCMNTEIFL